MLYFTPFGYSQFQLLVHQYAVTGILQHISYLFANTLIKKQIDIF